jgi:lipopolysaccharide export system protein LptA
MSPGRNLVAAGLVAGTVGLTGAASAPKPSPPLAVPGLRTDQPITVTAQTLEFDYKRNVVVYRGDVHAVQGDVHLHSDELTITLASADAGRASTTPPAPDRPAGDATLGGRVQLREVIATGRVRIDQGERWATGGRAVFDQERRQLVLSVSPVLHDGPNQISGDRVVVYLDEDRSVVEGGEKRVKAVLYPKREPSRDTRRVVP